MFAVPVDWNQIRDVIYMASGRFTRDQMQEFLFIMTLIASFLAASLYCCFNSIQLIKFKLSIDSIQLEGCSLELN